MAIFYDDGNWTNGIEVYAYVLIRTTPSQVFKAKPAIVKVKFFAPAEVIIFIIFKFSVLDVYSSTPIPDT